MLWAIYFRLEIIGINCLLSVTFNPHMLYKCILFTLNGRHFMTVETLLHLSTEALPNTTIWHFHKVYLAQVRLHDAVVLNISIMFSVDIHILSKFYKFNNMFLFYRHEKSHLRSSSLRYMFDEFISFVRAVEPSSREVKECSFFS